MGVIFFVKREWGGKVVAVYRASFESDKTLIGEEVWNRVSKVWEPTEAVSKFLLFGDNFMEQISGVEAASLLPSDAV